MESQQPPVLSTLCSEAAPTLCRGARQEKLFISQPFEIVAEKEAVHWGKILFGIGVSCLHQF
jgi:hypothetical protein